MLGSRVTTIAYPMLVLYLTGSPVDAGWVAFAATAPSILVYMPAGALVDRRDPRRVMLASEFGRGLAIAWVVAMMALGRPSIGCLVAAAVIEEILEVFSTLAERRYFQSLVPRDHASGAQVQIEARTHVVVLMGRPLGGLLFELKHVAPFITDVLSFAISVGTLLCVRSEQAAERAAFFARAKTFSVKGRLRKARLDQPPDWQLRKDIREGMHRLWDDQFARMAVALLASTTLICQATMMIFLAVAHSRALSSLAVGTVLAASGLGGALGSFAASRLPAPISWLRIQLWCWAAAFAILAISGGQSPLWMGIVMAVFGFTGALGNIEVSTHLIQNFAENMLARVTSIGRLLSFTACAVGPVIGGFLFQQCGVLDTVFALFVTTIILAAISSLAPSMRASYTHNAPRDPVAAESLLVL